MTKKEFPTITNYVSGLQVRVTPEEIDAVQVFSRQLVEDYGYPKEHIQVHPQFRVKIRPSDTKKEYPASDYSIFMGIANSCGHNKNGKEVHKINKDGSFFLEI